MARSRMSEPVEILSRRMDRVEQILPTLATKEDLRLAVKALATKEELKALATKEDLKALATKEELKALAADLRQEIREESERSRRYMTVLNEHQESKIELLAEHLLARMPKRSDE